MKDIKIKLTVDAETSKANAELLGLTETERKVAKGYEDIAKSSKKATDEQVTGAKKADKAVNETKKSYIDLDKTISGIGQTIVAAFAVEAIIAFAKESVNAFAEAELGAKKLEFAVKNLAGSGGFEKLNAEAEKLAGSSIFDDDAIKAAQTELLKYGLTVDEVGKLIPRLIDAASISGKSLDELVNLSVSAFEGRVIGVQKELGIALDKNATKTEMINQLFQGLSNYAGGASQALETTAGKMQKLSNETGELQESLGEKLVGAFDWVVNSFKSIGDPMAQTLKEVNNNLGEASRKANEQARINAANLNRINERAYDDGLILFKNYNLKKLQEEIKAQQASELLTKGLKGEKGYIKALEELLIIKQKEASAHKQTVKAVQPEITAYQKLGNALTELRSKLYDYITLNGAGDIALVGQINRLTEQKKKIDDLADAYLNWGKQIETTYTEIEDVPEPSLSPKAQQFLDKQAKDREETKNLRMQAEMEFFNLAFSLSNAIAQNELNNIQRVTQAQIDAEQTILDNKLQQAGITQQKREEYERNFEAKRLQIQKQAFEKEKQVKTAQALIEGALAVVRTFASYGGFTPAAIIAASAQAAQTAIQVGVIQAQKFEKGGWIDGKRHSEGGTIIEAERDEFVVNRRDAKGNSELLEAINKGNAHEYINRKFVMPAIIKKSIGEVQNGSLADNIAASLRNQMFDDHKLRKTITETSKRSALTIVEGLKQNQRPSRYN
jgi:hypothetical protein